MDDTTVVAKLDKDYIAEKGDTNRVGAEWTVKSIRDAYAGSIYPGETFEVELSEDTPKVRFRLKVDDGEVYYGGWLLNDEECLIQQAVLDWGTWDAGCTTIEVKVTEHSEWEAQIG